MGELRISDGMTMKFAATQQFAALDYASLKILTTEEIAAMYIDCKVLQSHVFVLAAAVAALEALVRNGVDNAGPFEGDMNALLNCGD
jgi:exosome complex RNA-binding protein Rrp42 (RNase PH superfamily)